VYVISESFIEFLRWFRYRHCHCSAWVSAQTDPRCSLVRLFRGWRPVQHLTASPHRTRGRPIGTPLLCSDPIALSGTIRSDNLLKEALNKSVLSFPRKREPSQFNKLDSRFRGNDDLISDSLNIVQQYFDGQLMALGSYTYFLTACMKGVIHDIRIPMLCTESDRMDKKAEWHEIATVPVH
jgi:hypothetical protein